MSRLILLLLLCCVPPFSAQAPTGCSYDASEILYTCNARSWSLPLAYSAFTSGEPQRILLKDLSGTLAANTFSGFSSINTAAFDSKYTPSLYIRCYASSQIILDGTAFTDFAYIDEVKIIDCDILSLPADVFTSFGEVNLFHITGGSISNMMPDAFKGLNVTKMTQYNDALGEFGIINSQLVSGSMAFGALYNMLSVERVRIESAHLLVTQVDMFKALTNMKYLSLNNNLFTKLDNNMFESLDALGHVDMHNIKWYCTCGYLWFFEYAELNNITTRGDIVCNEPVALANTRAAAYYKENCVEYSVCEGEIGFAMGGKCMTLLNILNYSFVLIALVISCVAFGMTMHTFRQMKAREGKDGGKGNPRGRKMSGSTWNKIANDQPQKGTRNPSQNPRRPSEAPKRKRNDDIIRSPREAPSIHAQSFDF